MGNFYSDNRDLVFTLKNLDLSESVGMLEENYTCSAKYPGAPVDFADALDNYERVLSVVGEVSADRIAPRSREVDLHGAKFADGVVTYDPLTVQNLKDLAAAGVMGVMLPHQYGGLNFPVSVYTTK